MPEYSLHDVRPMDRTLMSRNHRPEITKRIQTRFGHSVLSQFCWLGVVWLGCLPLFVSAQVTEPLHLEQGAIAGTSGIDTDIRAYKGIPYAAPPVADLRWRPPQPPFPWEGTFKADTFSPGCIQNLARSRPPWTEEFMHQGSIDEDCLYLNIWSGASDAEEKRPVLVYVHGGGFTEGSGSVPVYDGEPLAKKGLIVVTINYRLGLFGFFAHPELGAESDHSASGNYGLLDQVAALKWVQENISEFGGDPDNVTVAGQSAGAVSVHLLTASPLAKGLFHRVIVQSGVGGLASFGLTNSRSLASPLSDMERNGVEFFEAIGARSIEAMRAMPADELIAVSVPPTVRFWPVIDGYFLLDNVPTIYGEGSQNDVPMMTGFNADEGSAFPGYGQSTIEEYSNTVNTRHGERADAYLALYPAPTDEASGLALKTGLRDLAAVALGRLAVERAQSAETEAYLYYFERGIPWPERPEFGAFHTAEVPYFFNTLDHIDRPWTEVDRQLADLMSTYWVNFSTHGSPNGLDVPLWTAFDESDFQFMRLGTKIEFAKITDQTKTEFFLDYLSEQER